MNWLCAHAKYIGCTWLYMSELYVSELYAPICLLRLHHTRTIGDTGILYHACGVARVVRAANQVVGGAREFHVPSTG